MFIFQKQLLPKTDFVIILKRFSAFILVFYLFIPMLFGQEKKADFSKVPGTVIKHSAAISGAYVGTPNICILPNGIYLASHDLFGPKYDKGKDPDTFIYESLDKGKTWREIAHFKQFWSNLFYHHGILYCLGSSRSAGDLVIRKSTDNGHSWTVPADENSGVLLKSTLDTGYHTSSVPVVFQGGKIWRAVETIPVYGSWGGFKAFMISAKEGADLMKSASWTSTNHLDFNDDWKAYGNEWLEGNAVIAPDGDVVDVLRVDNKTDDVAAILTVSPDGTKINFDPAKGFINLPGACKKFSIRKAPGSNTYWTFTNAIPQKFKGGNVERTRNTLYLLSSQDLIHWEKKRLVLQGEDVAKHGFQYADWQFDGEDIVLVSRTAYDDGLGGADNQHNANFLTFHRIKNYKKE